MKFNLLLLIPCFFLTSCIMDNVPVNYKFEDAEPYYFLISIDESVNAPVQIKTVNEASWGDKDTVIFDLSDKKLFKVINEQNKETIKSFPSGYSGKVSFTILCGEKEIKLNEYLIITGHYFTDRKRYGYYATDDDPFMDVTNTVISLGISMENGELKYTWVPVDE